MLRRIVKFKIKLNSHALHNVLLRESFEWWSLKGVFGTGGGLPHMFEKIWRKYDTPSGKQHLFSELKTEAPNVRLKTYGKNRCYNVQHQVYVTSLTDTVKLLHKKVTADRYLNTSFPKNKAQILISWSPCLLRHTSFLSRHENERSEVMAYLGERKCCGRSGSGGGFHGEVKWIFWEK